VTRNADGLHRALSTADPSHLRQRVRDGTSSDVREPATFRSCPRLSARYAAEVSSRAASTILVAALVVIAGALTWVVVGPTNTGCRHSAISSDVNGQVIAHCGALAFMPVESPPGSDSVAASPPTKYVGAWQLVRSGSATGGGWHLYEVRSNQGPCFAVETRPATGIPIGEIPQQVLDTNPSLVWQGRMVQYCPMVSTADGDPVDIDRWELPDGAQLFFGSVARDVDSIRLTVDRGTQRIVDAPNNVVTVVVPAHRKLTALNVSGSDGLDMHCTWDGDEAGTNCSGSAPTA
jgi:hypothetical protein